jgi:transcriptional regulator with XRE-family HTH domain
LDQVDFSTTAVGAAHHIAEKEYLPQEVHAAIPGLSDILGKNVLKARELAGLSQMQLAQRAQINPDGLRDIELGRGNPRLGKVIRIATAFGVRVGELLARPGEYKPCPQKKLVLDPTEMLAQSARRGRTQLKMTQERFARLLHMHPEKITALEERDGDPTLEEMIRIAWIMKIEPWQLLAPWTHPARHQR